MSPATTIESAYLGAMHQRLNGALQRAMEISGGLGGTQLNWKPAPQSWSIAQCYEHMTIGAEEYAAKLRPAVERARINGVLASSDLPPRHTFAGRLIIRAVDPAGQRTMSSPKIFAPAHSEISDDVVDRFVASHQAIAELLVHSDGLDHNRIRLSSPVAAIIRINAADAFTILVYHAERHLNQAQRVRDTKGFPT